VVVPDFDVIAIELAKAIEGADGVEVVVEN
jgi:hypothetical protein